MSHRRYISEDGQLQVESICTWLHFFICVRVLDLASKSYKKHAGLFPVIYVLL